MMTIPIWLFLLVGVFAFIMGYQQNEHLREYKKWKEENK